MKKKNIFSMLFISLMINMSYPMELNKKRKESPTNISSAAKRVKPQESNEKSNTEEKNISEEYIKNFWGMIMQQSHTFSSLKERNYFLYLKYGPSYYEIIKQ